MPYHKWKVGDLGIDCQGSKFLVINKLKDKCENFYFCDKHHVFLWNVSSKFIGNNKIINLFYLAKYEA